MVPTKGSQAPPSPPQAVTNEDHLIDTTKWSQVGHTWWQQKGEKMYVVTMRRMKKRNATEMKKILLEEKLNNGEQTMGLVIVLVEELILYSTTALSAYASHLPWL